MTILAEIPHNHENLKVEVMNVITTGDGRKLAVVRALTGKPFTHATHGGWCESNWTNIPVNLLYDVHQDPQPEPASPNLLDLALAAHKAQWYSGEVVWIWRNNGKGGAYLKNKGGFVTLNLTGHQPSCVVFYLLPIGWQTSKVVKADYHKWVEKVQEAK